MGISQTPQAIVPAAFTDTTGMTLLSTTNLSGTSTTISGINQSYVDLRIIIQNYFVNSSTTLLIRPNGTQDVTAYMYQVYDTASGSSGNNGTGGYDIITPDMSTSSQPASTCMALDIFQYSNSSFGKPFSLRGGHRGANLGAFNGGGIFRSTSAISSIVFRTANGSSTFSGGTVLIYGVK